MGAAMNAEFCIHAGRIWLWTPYNADFVDDLKRSIHARFRKWDAENGVWRIHIAHRDAAVDCMLRHYDDVAQVPAAELLMLGDADDDQGDYAALHLLPSAPPELVKAAHRCLAKLAHPDKGGDVVTMQRINAAADRILGR